MFRLFAIPEGGSFGTAISDLRFYNAVFINLHGCRAMGADQRSNRRAGHFECYFW